MKIIYSETHHKFYETMPSWNTQRHAYNEHLANDFPSLLRECQQPQVNEPLSSRYVGTFPPYFLHMFQRGIKDKPHGNSNVRISCQII